MFAQKAWLIRLLLLAVVIAQILGYAFDETLKKPPHGFNLESWAATKGDKPIINATEPGLEYATRGWGCREDLSCLSCNRKYLNACDECYNFDSGMMPAKMLTYSNKKYVCTKELYDNLRVMNCRVYSSSISEFDNNRTVKTCFLCNAIAPFLYWKAPINEPICTARPPTWCKKIENCSTQVCYESGKPLAPERYIFSQ
jgi:hypothetical protein